MTLTQTANARNDRRSRIVLAASQMFAARRYADVQMDDVAKAASVAKPTIYRYFKSKEELFLEALDGTMSELAGAVTRIAAESGPAHLALRRMIDAALHSFVRCGATIRSPDGSDADLGERGRALLRERGRQVREEVAAVLQRGVADGAFRSLDAEVVSRVVLGAAWMTANAEGGPTDAGALDALVDLLLNGLAARASAQET